jgi:transposase
MSYIVEQKIKGRIYLYEVESYWDSKLKQPRQKRKYIGRKKDDFKQDIISTLPGISVKIFDDTFLLQGLAERLGLIEILQNIFPGDYRNILALAYYDIAQADAAYLFHYWVEEHNLKDVRKLDSTELSVLFEELGKKKDKLIEFQYQWIEHLQLIEAVYYDITSISSYATNNEFIEWGYNRDGDKLPQVNIGAICCSLSMLPIAYRLYGGSIVDVTTLKNTFDYLASFGMKDFMCIMDRGFYSASNIIGLNHLSNKVKFIQPLPFSLKKVRDMVNNNKRGLGLSYNAFMYNQELLYYVRDEYTLDADNKFEAHIYFNEKSKVDQKQVVMQKILEWHQKLCKQNFASKKEFMQYRQTEIPANFREYFRWERLGYKVGLNNKAIEKTISRLGTFVIASNQNGLTKEQVLTFYRKKDAIEKLFDVVKNEMDGYRLRVHSHTNTEGRMFIRFIALILYCEITKTLKENDLFKKMTVKEMFAELRKIKLTSLKGHKSILSELSRRHKQIFEAFNLNCTLT